ncbi:MAG: malto-oligosyltrehalose synthase [Terriglobia bacterium]
MAALRVPLATYRLQFNQQWRFAGARALVAYLHALGLTDLYASPLLAARQGSSHGYDVIDPTRLNPELGSEEEFAALVGKLRRHGMGLLLDIVPNHMAASSENPWWMDVLENGTGSPYAAFFDIDWHPANRARENKLVLPILGDPYRTALENQELRLTLEENGFFIRTYDAKLPLAPGSYAGILRHRMDALAQALGADHPAFRELGNLLRTSKRLPQHRAPDDGTAEERQRERESFKQRLWRLYQAHAVIREFLDENLRLFNGQKGDSASFKLLDQLLAEQAYRLAFWREGNKEVNYRRFFALSDLVCIRVEQPRVFEATHALLLRLGKEGKVTGLRVDHVDGLREPLGYLRRLQNGLAATEVGAERFPSFYIIVEKILAAEETLPAEWPVHGTTGYEFLNALNGIFVDARGSRALAASYRRFTKLNTPFAKVVYTQKKQVMERLFAAEMRTLGEQLRRLATQDRQGRTLAGEELTQALIEVTACFPVYRTYVREFKSTPRDRRTIARALQQARRRNPTVGSAAFRFLRRVLLLERPRAEQKETWREFVLRWQQHTGPIMAKGFEDTALYIYNPLISLNEVGGEPEAGAIPVELFHRRIRARQQRWPYTLNAISTHDTKRSEDVRARINVLSELPKIWEKNLERWSRWNQAKKRRVNARPAPDRNEEVLLYQTLLGAWPLAEEEVPAFRERLKSYMVKAAREAKLHTSWLEPNPAHESALAEFVEAILRPSTTNRFWKDFLRFQKQIAHYGALNALAQVLVKIAAPGVPDFYQGTELWDFSLVDPDNRRPVDFQKRAQLLKDLQQVEAAGLVALARALLADWRDGRVKLYLTYKALQFRRDHRELFLDGDYIPLQISGARKKHACAFARRQGEDWALVVVPRLATQLVAEEKFPLGDTVWGRSGVILPRQAPPRWLNVFTGETLEASSANRKSVLPLGSVLRNFPVALLTQGPAETPSVSLGG